MGVPVTRFLKNRRDRAVGTILGHIEREVYPKLSAPERETLRRVVIDATNSYHDTVLDLVKAEDGVRNEKVIELLERIEGKVDTRRRQKQDAGV
jgi:hypothetical protein